MKNFFSMSALLITSLISALLLFSCAGVKPQLATVKAPVKQNESVISANLKTFLANHPDFSVVLRTPDRADDITVAQREQDNIICNELEKALIAAGFDVKDRASVTNVLNQMNRSEKKSKDDIFDYKKIGQMLNVDMFIEITALSINLPFYQDTYQIKATGEQRHLRDANGNVMRVLSASYAQFGFRFVIAQTGSVGGMFTVYHQRCTEGCDFYVLSRPGQSTLYQMPDQLGSSTAYNQLQWVFYGNTDREIAAYFANQLINALKSK
jgi:hypothetical protein